ncbi:MAG: PPC domain-containing protein [Halovenus sp.]
MTRSDWLLAAVRSVTDGLTPGTTARTLVVCLALAASLAVAGGGVAGAADVDWDGDTQSDEFEPNDDFDTATEIAPPFDRDGLQTDVEDFDIYAVQLEPGDRLDVSVTFDHNQGDVDLLLYDPNRDVVESSVSVDDNESASLQASIPGEFYVLVFGLSETATDYSLSVTATGDELPPNDEFEYNDGLSSAAVVATPFERYELRLAEGDTDFYAVEAGAGDRLNVSTRFDHAEADVDLRLYGPDEEVAWTELSFTDNESFSYRVQEGGTHYVEVFSTDREAAWYSMSMEVSGAQGLARYANEEGVVDTEGLRDAIDDWRSDEIDTGLLRDAIGAWRTGDRVG